MCPVWPSMLQCPQPGKICQTDISNAWPKFFLQCSVTSVGTKIDCHGHRNWSTDNDQENGQQTGGLLLSGVELQGQKTSEPLRDKDHSPFLSLRKEMGEKGHSETPATGASED